MKPIQRAALTAALALSLSAPAMAAGAAPKQTPRQTPPAAAGEARASMLTGQVVYQVLLGEIALQRGNPDLASSAYADLAFRTRDPKVFERAVEIASITRRFDLAHELSRLWVGVEPDSVNARQTLAAVLIMQNRIDELGPQLSTLLAQDSNNLADNLMRLNRMLARLPDKSAIHRMLTTVLAPYAGVAEAHYALATAAFHAGNRAEALVEIRKAAALRPDWETAALFEAQLLARDSTEAAIGVLERFVAAQPQAREARLHLARALIAEKRHTEARKHFERMLADDPDGTELIYPAALLALQQGEPEAAEPLLLRLFERGEAGERSVAAFHLGQLAEDRGDALAAVGFYSQVAVGEQFVSARVRSAGLLRRTGGELTAARAYLQEAALRYPPGQTQFLIAETHLVHDAGEAGEARTLFERIVGEHTDRADVLYDTALLAEKLDRMDIAERNLRRVIALQPDNAHAYNALGYSFADRNIRLDEARQLIDKAIELAPGDPFIMDSVGWVRYRQGDLPGALDALQRAYALRPDAEIAAHLGEVLWMKGRRDEAQALWRKASERFPDSEVLKSVRRKFVP